MNANQAKQVSLSIKATPEPSRELIDAILCAALKGERRYEATTSNCARKLPSLDEIIWLRDKGYTAMWKEKNCNGDPYYEITW